MSTKLKLVLFLVPAIAAVIFIVWWRSPTRVVLRRLDALIELTEVSPLRLRSPEQLPGHLQTLTAPTVDLRAPRPIPSGSFTREQIASSISELHSSVGSCTLTRGEARVHFPSPDEARVKTPLDARLAWGRGSSRTELYHAELRFSKTPDGWLLDEIRLVPR